MESGARIVYEVNKFRLDLQKRLLISKADGTPIPLSAKLFDTLRCFVEHRGELLDKSTLMKAIRPNVVVEENNLNQNIEGGGYGLESHDGPFDQLVLARMRTARQLRAARWHADLPLGGYWPLQTERGMST